MTRIMLVPKEAGNARMDYNGTINGLNGSMWDPHLDLTTVRKTLRSIYEGTLMEDRSVGEMLLNFVLGKM